MLVTHQLTEWHMGSWPWGEAPCRAGQSHTPTCRWSLIPPLSPWSHGWRCWALIGHNTVWYQYSYLQVLHSLFCCRTRKQHRLLPGRLWQQWEWVGDISYNFAHNLLCSPCRVWSWHGTWWLSTSSCRWWGTSGWQTATVHSSSQRQPSQAQSCPSVSAQWSAWCRRWCQGQSCRREWCRPRQLCIWCGEWQELGECWWQERWK